MKETNSNNSRSVLGATALGVVIGAASVALVHKPTRTMLKDKLSRALEEGDKTLDKAADKVGEIKTKTRKAAVRELKKTQAKLENSA